ncbi:hypothetical protein KA005_81540 [bacterium]|nr:hypothetical protein [bacterium]
MKNETIQKEKEEAGGNSNYGLRGQIGKRIELSVYDEKSEYYGILRSLDDLGIVTEWSDEKIRVYRFFQWENIRRIWWNRDK